MATMLTISAGVLALVFGILVLSFPKFLRYFVGIYFLIFGLLQIFS